MAHNHLSSFPTTSIFPQNFEPVKLPVWMPERMFSQYDVANNLYGRAIIEQVPAPMRYNAPKFSPKTLEELRKERIQVLLGTRSHVVEDYKRQLDTIQPNLHTNFPFQQLYRK